jgi:polyhydroxyalkanoate synthesis regulator protein
MTPDVVILKYPNRKLYNRTDSVYVTGSKILELVRAGRKVQIVEKSSGKVITGPILAQALLDEGDNQFYSQESVEVLERIIRDGNFEIFSKKLL